MDYLYTKISKLRVNNSGKCRTANEEATDEGEEEAEKSELFHSHCIHTNISVFQEWVIPLTFVLLSHGT